MDEFVIREKLNHEIFDLTIKNGFSAIIRTVIMAPDSGELLPCLQQMSFWNLPNSLKNLVLTVNEERIDLNELKNLKNLEYLQLIYYSPEIQPIEISSQLQQFRIRTTLKKLTLSSWKLPDFVQVLDISGEIELIKDLYKFPSQLQDLILSHNNLRDLPTFPPTLKNLNLIFQLINWVLLQSFLFFLLPLKNWILLTMK